MGLLVDVVDGDALDLPGFGMSPPMDRLWSVRAYADVVTRLIEKRGSGALHLIGNSLGGAIATRVAAERPELVRTLSLISPALPDLRLTRTTFAVGIAGIPWVGGPLLRRLAALPPERRVDLLIKLCIAEPSLVPEEWREYAVEEVRRRSGLPYASRALALGTRGIIGEYLDPRPRRLWRMARRVTAPTLLIYGRSDRLVHPRTAIRARRTYPNARLVILNATGHVAQIERPATVATEIRDLLSQAATSSTSRL